MGRKPVPTELQRRRGNPSRRKLPEPIRLAPLDGIPAPPEDLGPTEQEAWRSLAEPLAEAGALQRLHLPLLRQFAVATGVAERARKALEDEPLTVAGARGGMILNPNLRAWRDAVTVLVRIGAEFGATPSSLTGMGLAQLRGKTLQQELADRYRKAT